MLPIEYYSYDDYSKWKGDWELIKGIPLALSPSPTITHQIIVSKIVFELKESKNCLILSGADWKISNDTVVRPDVVLTCNETNDTYMTDKSP